MEKRLLTRRHFLQAVAGLTATAAAGYGYARYLEPSWVAIERLRLPVRNLPPTLVGRRFAQISDVHLGALGCPTPDADGFPALQDHAMLKDQRKLEAAHVIHLPVNRTPSLLRRHSP